MNYLKEYRTEATKKIKDYCLVSVGPDEPEALKELLDWFAEKQLESYRNGQGKGKVAQSETPKSGKSA